MSDSVVLTDKEQKQDQTITKAELFEKEPDNFIHISELMLAVKEEGDQKQLLVGPKSPSELGGALFLLTRHVNKLLDAAEFQRFQEKEQVKKMQQNINKKGFRDFIKGKK